MHFLYVVPEYPPYSRGGIATFYQQLLPAIARHGHSVRVLVANAFMDAFEPYEQDGVEVDCLCPTRREAHLRSYDHYAATPYLQRYLATAWAAWEQAQKIDSVDLVETTDWGLLFSPWAAAHQRPPTVVQCHGSVGQISQYDPQAGQELEGHLAQLIEHQGLMALDGLQTYSRLNQTAWQQELQRSVDCLPPAYAAGDAISAGESYRPQLSSDRPGALLQGLVVGRIQSWKGPQVLCEALLQLADAAPCIQWAGRDMPWQQSASLSAVLGQRYPQVWGSKIQPIGSHPPSTIRQLQTAADFVVVPSTWDVFNLSGIEAMAQGKVVIASRGSGLAEWIEPGQNGLCFPAGDSQALADCLLTLQQLSPRERRRIGQAARATVLAQFEPGAIAQQRLEQYAKLKQRPLSCTPAAPSLIRAVCPQPSLRNPHAFLNRLSLRSLIQSGGERLLQKRVSNLIHPRFFHAIPQPCPLHSCL